MVDIFAAGLGTGWGGFLAGLETRRWALGHPLGFVGRSRRMDGLSLRSYTTARQRIMDPAGRQGRNLAGSFYWFGGGLAGRDILETANDTAGRRDTAAGS
jgi:hypothetical protein